MKRKIYVVAKFVVSFALIGYLLLKTDLNALYASLLSTHLGFLFLAFLSLNIGKVLSGYRWQYLLAGYGIRLPLNTLIVSLFVGQFFNNFLPTTVGGDAIRAYDVALQSKEFAKSLTSVFIDRLIGVFALALLAIIALLVGKWIGNDVSLFVWIGLGVFSLCVLSFITVFNRTLKHLIVNNLQRLGLANIATKIHRIYSSLEVIKRNRLVFWIALIISIILQINVILFYYFIALSLQMKVSLLYFFIIIPIALIVLLVPFTINGLGLREGIFVFLLAKLSVPTQEALAFSLLGFILTMTQGIIGGVLFAFRGNVSGQLRENLSIRNKL